ncbi:MAG: hypothetical protein WKF74_04990 [Pyrinomonadaceae bacterium]
MIKRSAQANFLFFVLATFLCVVLNFNSAFGQSANQASEELLTNASVVKLVRAKFSEKAVTAIIRSRPTRFDLSPDALVQLKRNGVSERIILAMIARSAAAETANGDWDEEDDSFFNEGRAQMGRSGGGDTNIFGSGGSSQSRTRGGGLNGGASGDTQTTGSATVRIIRPPSEGGAEPKLERTPTLTNEGVIEMINAGFSEGTIIRRIEASSSDFDLSPTKLAELRRRRVSEKVISAMKEAMSDGSDDASRTSSNSGN